MKNFVFTILCLIGVTAIFSCSKEDTSELGVPSWAANYPKTLMGATTVDVVMNVDKKSTAYWVITDQPVTLTPAELKTQAVSGTNPAVKFKGTSTLSKATEKIETISGLTENKKYYAYVVSENVADTKIQESVSSAEGTTKVRQTQGQYTSGATVENRPVQFLIYRSEESLKYPEKKHPILFFLGGDGEVATGSNINMIRNGTLPEFLSLSVNNNVPMMVMSIQHTVTNWNAQLINEGITYALANFPSDPKKLYLTGISGGGFGAWRYAIAYPDVLAAMIPISGGGDTGQACKIKNVPVWAFTNKTDPIVNVSGTANMITAINACSPAPATAPKYDIFTDDGHDCWRRVYDKNHGDWTKGTITGAAAGFKPDIYAWLLTKSK